MKPLRARRYSIKILERDYRYGRDSATMVDRRMDVRTGGIVN